MLASRSRSQSFPKLVVLAVLAAAAPGCVLLVPPELYASKEQAKWYRGFGYASVGFTAYADFFGEIHDVSPGVGFSANFPLAPGPILVAGAAALVVAAAATGNDNDIRLDFGSGRGDFRLGTSGRGVDVHLDIGNLGGVIPGSPPPVEAPPGPPGWRITPDAWVWSAGLLDDRRKGLVSDAAFDVTISGSFHKDSATGGTLDYWAFLIGVRLGGSHAFIPRAYLTGGVGAFSFVYSSRPDANVWGPYVGCGLEWFAGPGSAVALDYKAHFYFGEDTVGVPVDGGASLVSALFSWYW
jgi:hypothetical protein